MNVCTASGSQGNAAPPLKMAEKIAFAFAAPSLRHQRNMPPHRGEGRRTDVGTVIKFPSPPRGPRASEGSAFALQNEAARLNGLFFQLPFRPRAEVEWSVVQCARANMHSTCARCGDSRKMADLDSGAQPHCILTADAPPSPEDRFLGEEEGGAASAAAGRSRRRGRRKGIAE